MKLRLGIGLIILFIGLAGCKLADIRTDEVRTSPDEIKGMILLKEMREAHHVDQLDSMNTLSLHITDAFFGMGKIANPFPKNKAEFDFAFIPNSFTSRATFTNPKWENKIWGIQSWKTYEDEGDSVQFHKKNDRTMEFWLPTYQYLIELPSRIIEADQISFAGLRDIGETSYELLFASWNSDIPQKDVDQYVLWINQETKRLQFVQYTVRDQGKIIHATLEIEGYHDVNGLLIPKQMHVRMFDKFEGKILHSITTSQVEPDKISKDLLLPNTDLGTSGKN